MCGPAVDMWEEHSMIVVVVGVADVGGVGVAMSRTLPGAW